MVDTTSSYSMLPQEIVAAEDRVRTNRAADIWMNNMLALIKLRQKWAKVSKLPKGVFRHMLEYQFPNELLWRYSDPYAPIKGYQGRHFPAIEKLDYNNYLVALNELPNDYQY